MPRRNFILPAVALAGLILFFCFLVHLLLLRYERGDVYPEYSTLRADPLGTRAYYEALDSMRDYPVARGFRSLHRELAVNPNAIFYLGFNVDDFATFTKEDISELDTFVKNGGRVVMTFAPEEPGARDEDDSWKKAYDKKKAADPDKKTDAKPDTTPPAKADAALSEEKNAGPQTEQEKFEREEFRREREEDEKDNPRKPHDGTLEKYQRSLAALWGFGWEDHTEDKPKKPAENSYAEASKPVEEKPEVFAQHLYEGNVEAQVPWKSALYFVRLEPQWQRIYSAKYQPVLVRRTWGKGEIILATDSYFISNEALRNDRRPQLLSFVTGAPGRLLFDETHLGTEEKEGVMFLAEKFKLEGYLYGILGVVLLFLWRNSAPLVPPRLIGRNAALGGAVSGKDSRSGLVNLLRRNIAASEILKTSFGEWRRVAPNRSNVAEKTAEMQAIITVSEGAKAETLVESYHLLREINTPSRAKNYATKS
jgi:hypothetical protein